MIVVVVLFLSTIVVLTGFWGYSYDDAFITYRYSANLLNDGRLAFNPGEPTYGTTAPGYAVLLAALAYLSEPLGISIPGWGSLLGTAGLAAILLVLTFWPQRGTRSRFRPWLVVAAPLLICLRWNVEMLGCEALPAMGLVAISSFLLFARNQEVGAGLVLACAAMLRLDAGLACIIFGLVFWKKKSRFPWRLLVAGAAPLLLYSGWLWLYFGQLLPDTLNAKQGESLLTDQSLTQAQWSWLARTLDPLGAVCFLILAAIGVIFLFKKHGLACWSLSGATLWLLCHELAYRLVGVPFAPWYHLPTVAGGVLASVYSASRISQWLIAKQPSRMFSPLLVTASTILILLPILIPTGSWLRSTWKTPPDPRWNVYHDIGNYIRKNSSPQASIAAVEIGFLGMSSERPILDLMGLVTPEAVDARRSQQLAEFVATRSPEFILDVPLFHPATLGDILIHPFIERCYKTTSTFQAPEYMGRVRLLQKRPKRNCSRYPEP